MSNVRYYRGIVKMVVLYLANKKALVQYLEDGRVGSLKHGYKYIKKLDKDIVLTRFCYKNRKPLTDEDMPFSDLFMYKFTNNLFGDDKKLGQEK